MKLVLVEWEDAYTSHGWKDDEDTESLRTARTTSCGLLKKEENGFVSLVQSQGRGVYSDAITIPKGCIKRMRKLKIG